MERKKALVINASPRTAGSTALVLGLLERRLAGVYDVERVELGAAAIRPCTGCQKCRPDGTCVLPRDAAQEIGEKIAQTDLLAIGAPCYWGNVPSTLKALFDRNVTTFESFSSGLPSPKLREKKAVLLVTSGSPFPFSRLSSQAGGTARAIKTVLKSGGMRILGVGMFASAWKLDRLGERAKKAIARLRIE
jgi:multimeric flavodoxin WrbA